jgi:prenyltransferase beta subunit
MKYREKVLSLVILLSLFLLSAQGAVLGAPRLARNTPAEIDSVIEKGLDFLQQQVNPDGGISWVEETSSPAATLRVVLALAAAGYPQDYLLSESGSTPIDFLAESAADWINQRDTENPDFSVSRAGQLLTAVAAGNRNPRGFGPEELDLIGDIMTAYDANSGAFGNASPENVVDQVWAMIGLAAAHANIPADAVIWLENAQLENGSWDDGWGSFLDTTPLAVIALIGSGQQDVQSEAVQSAVNFMESTQQSNGGWQTEWDTTTNANTTGMMLQAISLLGQLPMDENWQKADGNPLTAVASLQQENGVIGGEFANAYSTADAILGLSGQPLTFLGYLTRSSKAFDFIFSQQTDDGGWGTIGQTVDVILALRAAGWDPQSVSINELTPIASIAAQLDAEAISTPDSAGKVIIGLVASGEDPTDFAGINLVEALLQTYDESAGAFGDPQNTWHQALAILGLTAAGAEVPEAGIATLKGLQAEDGGWEYTPGFGTWPDNTALAIQALIAAGTSAEENVIQDGLDYIATMQTPDGGWGDSSTTAFVLTALNALGEASANWRSDAGMTPLPTLFGYQKINGSFVYTWEYPDDNLMSTTAVLFAVFGGDFLVTPLPAGETNYAGLVIDPHDAGELQTICVSFEEDTVSGMDLLEVSGISFTTEEGFINTIIDVGNPEGGTMYWSYWYWDGHQWQFHETGGAEAIVYPGSIEAWLFTSWETFPSPAPNLVPSLAIICDMEVLKNYNAQPYLSYEDLTLNMEAASAPAVVETPEVEETEATETTKEATEVTEPTKTEIPEPTQESEPTEEAEPTENKATEETSVDADRNFLPVIFIAGIGLLLVIGIILVIIRKRS